ncbi:DUF397 domain-containing protein, partial [Streptomyces sp. UNOC14_S4]|nr:DUF397 domain-containing protein [Streptomyces sp. UNOC14_S4]
MAPNRWQKSTYSADSSNCLNVAIAATGPGAEPRNGGAGAEPQPIRGAG